MDVQELETRYTYHAPKADQPGRYASLRGEAQRLAALIEALCPESREKALAHTNVEQAIMWANAAIARRE